MICNIYMFEVKVTYNLSAHFEARQYEKNLDVLGKLNETRRGFGALEVVEISEFLVFDMECKEASRAA